MTAPAGKRRHRIDVQQHNGNVVDGEATYGRDEDWNTILEGVNASYRGVSGGEVIRGLQMEGLTTGVLEVLQTERTRQINQKMRLLLNGERILNIVSCLDPDGMRRDLVIQTTEVGR